MKHLKIYILAALTLLLCLLAVACQVDLVRPPAQEETSAATTTPSPFLPDGFRRDWYEKKVEDTLQQRILNAPEDEQFYVIIIHDGPTEEQINAVIEERWQIMKNIQSGSEPSQETDYTLPREGDGIRNRIALERDVAREMHLKSAYRVTDEFFPDENQIIYISMFTSQISAYATREQIRALSQSPLVLFVQDGESRKVTSTY